MNRRVMLTTTAALPVTALPLGGIAAPANGTDAAWRALLAADAEHKAKVAALDAAEAAWLPAEPPTVTATLPAMQGKAARPVTLDDLRKARESDPLLTPMSDNMEAVMRDMLAREAEYRPLRTPDAVAERRALYDRLEAELQASQAATRPVKPAHVARLESELKSAEDRAEEADEALLAAPVLTIKDAARKLEHALARHMDPEDWNGKLVTSALAGLRGIIAAERLA